jgi:ADP-heptose:LPS heptosyltransferase
MKILVVSLLRLGDIIQQEPLLRGLREKFPQAEIHLLLNKQFIQVEGLVQDSVDKFIYFEREQLQKGLGEASYNVLWSYHELNKLVATLDQEKYDSVYNFTHNRLSAYLIGAVECSDKRGLHHNENNFRGLDGRWIRYFNDRFAGNQRSLFHYVELLGKSFDLPLAGPVKASAVKKSKLVLMQCLTSDVKKNWGLDRFAELKLEIERNLVDYEVLVVAAPFEREKLLTVFAEKDLLICDLNQAREHLKKAALLVTGDTSIKHLAASVGTPIVEIAIGSSDGVKTGAFSLKALTVQATTACYPCNHSQNCSQKSHLCAEEIAVGTVFEKVWDCLAEEKRKASLTHRALEKEIWSVYLDKEHKEVEPFYAASAQNFCGEYDAVTLQGKIIEWQDRTIELQQVLARIEKSLPTLEALRNKSNLVSQDLSEIILCAQDLLRSKVDEGGYFQGFIESLIGRFANPAHLLEKITRALTQVRELLEVRQNLIHQIQTLSMEGEFYAKGIGQLSISGFDETPESLQRDIENAGL